MAGPIERDKCQAWAERVWRFDRDRVVLAGRPAAGAVLPVAVQVAGPQRRARRATLRRGRDCGP